MGCNYRRSKRFCSSTVLCVSFTWQMVKNTNDQILSDRRSKHARSNCVLCISCILSGSPNECWLHTCWPQLFKHWIVLPTGWITTQQINIRETKNCTIHWIDFYAVDSAIQRLNNQGLEIRIAGDKRTRNKWKQQVNWTAWTASVVSLRVCNNGRTYM